MSAAAEAGVAVYASFDALPVACQAMLDRCAPDVFSALPWYRNLEANALAEAGALRIYVVGAAGAPRLIVPMWHARPGAGRVLQAAANFYASLFTPAASDEAGLACSCRLWARALAAERPRWDRVTLAPLAPESPLYAHAGAALREAGFSSHQYYCFANWYLRVGGRGYAEFLQGLPSHLRHTLMRKGKRLAAMPHCRIALLSTPAEAGEAARAFQRVYANSWKEPEPYPAFVPGLIRTCAEQGWLRMGVAYVNETPVAFQIWIVRGGSAAIYKLAYDRAYARLSLGSLLTAALVRHAIELDGVTHIDYLTGDDVYKRDWMSDRRERWGIVGFNLGTVRGLAGAAIHQLGRCWRRWAPAPARHSSTSRGGA